MKRNFPRILLLCLALFALAACGRGRDTASAPDVEATVAAAVQATTAAQAQMQSSIDAAVQATATALAANAALTPTPTPIVITTTETVTEVVTDTVTETVTEIVYVPQDVYVTMTEEELQALIDQSVEQAVAATEASAQSASTATSDAVVTSEEVQTVEVYVQLAEETIAYAEEVLATYGQLYADGSAEMVAALNGIEQELATLNQSAASIATSLEEISTTLDAGLALAEESIAQLESAAASAQATVDQAQAQAEVWQTALQEQADRARATQSALQEQPTDLTALIQNIQPQQMAGDLPAALQMTRSFAEVAQRSLADGRIDQNEILAIAQAGADASAGLKNFGGPQVQGMAGTIDGITSALARNDLPAARQGLDGLNAQMPAVGTNPAPAGRPGNVQPPAGGRRP
ncbi:MAG: hypothetical protein HY328_12235 [Chloroflexi bacterium]|nr:hypothetical protein [Chloroflexota bacterium]